MAGSMSPTAANIISSLGIKGAIGSIPDGAQGSSFSGFIPILNADGKIDLSFIPPGAAEMSVQRFHNVAIVDPMTECETRTGSVIAPFKTASEAAASITPDEGYDNAARCAIVLMPGKYDDSLIAFSSEPSEAFIICVGQCVFGKSTVAISGIRNGGALSVSNIYTDGNISVSNCSNVTFLGTTVVRGNLTLAQGAELAIAPESYVASTNASSVIYLSDSSRVGNSSSVTGNTVSDALDTLGSRAIRVVNMSYGDSGFDYDEDDFSDIEAIRSGAVEVYDLRGRDKAFADGVNRLVVMWKNPTVGELRANTVNAGKIVADEMDIAAISIGGYKVTIDQYGYLVVVDGDEPVNPPTGVILIRDSDTHEVYVIGIASGRMYVAKDPSPYDSSDDTSSPHPEIVDSITLEDHESGTSYEVEMHGGTLCLSPAESGSSDVVERRSSLYAMDESTGKMYRVVAFVDQETGVATIGLDQHGVWH